MGRGWSVEVLEAAHEIGHAFAGSKGGARIFRLGYPEPHYVEMALSAREQWRALERESGRQLLWVTGQLTFGDEDALAEIEAALVGHGVTCERLTPEAAQARYPGIATTGTVLLEPDSGVLVADECLEALRATAGFDVRTGARVTALRGAEDGVEIVTADRTELRADVVVALCRALHDGAARSRCATRTAWPPPRCRRWPTSGTRTPTRTRSLSSSSGVTT